jgi:hypothetical protein
MPDDASIPGADPSTRARKEKIALDRLSLARTFALAANRVFLIFVVSLALLWQQRVFPDLQASRSVERARVRFLTSRVAVARDDQQTLPLLDGVDRPVVQTLEQQWQEQANQARNSPWKLFGFELPVPVYYSALVWTLLCFVLLSYLTFIRRRHFALLGRALRILRSDVGYSSEDLADLCPGLPWWLLPVCRRDGEVVRSTDLIAAAGWQASYRHLYVLQVAALATLLVLQLFTGWVGWRVVSTLATQDKAEQFLLLELTLLVQVMTLASVYEWMRPARVPDHRSHEENPNGWHRRDVFGVGMATSFALAFYPTGNVLATYSEEAPSRRGGNPRFRRARSQAGSTAARYSTNGLLNQRTGTLHYVRSDATQHLCLAGITPEHVARMKPVEFVATLTEAPRARRATATPSAAIVERSTITTTAAYLGQPGAAPLIRVHASCAAWAVEQAVEGILRESGGGRAEQAAKLLADAIERDPENLRLYDRLAVLTIKHPLTTYRAELVRLATNHLRSVRSHLPRVREAKRSANTGAVEPGAPPPFWRDLLNRALGVRSAAEPHLRQRQRHRCTPGTPQLRTGTRMKTPVGAALEARIAAWQNPTSRWHKRWTSPDREWRLPTAASPCKMR